jgi:uncharacterized protein (PEP-CTERM system associated)
MPRRHPERRLRVATRRSAWIGGAAAVASLAWPVQAAWAADGAATQRQWAIEPSVSVTQTFSDNPDLRAVGQQADSVTRLTLGLGLRANTGQMRGMLDYSLSSLLHARGSERNALQNQLNAQLLADALDKRLHLEASASIARSAISAFSAQPDGSANIGSNTTEQRSLRLAPSWQGPLGRDLRYVASLAVQASDVKDSAVGDNTSATAALHLEPVRVGRLSWTADISHVTSHYKAGRTTDDDRVYATMVARVDELDLRLNANAGIESTNLTSADRQQFDTWGVGAEWLPSARTRVAVDYGQRFFGKSYGITLEHRTPLTVWRFTDSRSLSLGSGGSTFRGTAYDLFYAQFASTEPDPTKRADLVNGFLKLNGIDPQTSLNLDFLRSGATVQDRQDLSVAWRGVRDTVMLMFTRSGTRRIDDGNVVFGDLAQSNNIDQRGLSIDWSHRLTPQSNLSLLVSQVQGRGQLASQESWQRQYLVQYMLSPSAKSSLIAGLRVGQYERPGLSYGERAVFLTYGLRF